MTLMESASSKKILVIDDDASVLHALGLFLEQEGYDVQTASGYNDQLKGIRPSQLPNLIVLDILLSDKNGCDIARELKAAKSTANVPIVMISAHPDGREMAMSAGADGFLAKPFDIDELLDTVARLANGKA